MPLLISARKRSSNVFTHICLAKPGCRPIPLARGHASVTWSVLGPAQLRKANAIFIIKIVYFFGICSKIGN